MAAEDPKPRYNIFNVPNTITIVRICAVPLFIAAVLAPWPDWMSFSGVVANDIKALIATILFVLISLTDTLDGYLARRLNQITDFGKFVDPLADKILVISALLVLVELDVLPSWPVIIIISREFIVSGVRMMAATKGVVIAASWYGKAKTATQMLAIILFLLKDFNFFGSIAQPPNSPIYILAWVVMIITLILTIVSMCDYIGKARYLFIDG